jgi:alpha-tubulin suppressor-like RCC1 family protein
VCKGNGAWGPRLAVLCAGVTLTACGARSSLGTPDGAVGAASAGLRIALGTSYGCAILPDRGVACWGRDEPGDPTPEQIPPRRISGLAGVRRLAVGYFAACAVRDDGSVWCWGPPMLACALGQESPVADRRPRQVAAISDAVDVKTSGEQSCALRRDGTVWCWGQDDYRAVGRPGTPPSSMWTCYLDPQPVAGVADILQIALSDCHSCALRRDGTVLCWGRVGGQDTSTPIAFGGLGQVRSIAAAQEATLAVREDGGVLTWGDNDYGVLGLGYGAPNKHDIVATPTPVAGVTAIGASGSYGTLCVLLSDGRVGCSGSNYAGQLGDDTPDLDAHPTFKPIPEVAGVVAVDTGTWGSCGQRSDGSFLCWGDVAGDDRGSKARLLDVTPK